MKTYILIFRMDIVSPEMQPSKEQMATYMQDWMKWINSIIDKGQLADGGLHITNEGRVLRPDNELEEKPYSVNNESINGYIVVSAENIDDAVKLAEGCPLLNGRGTSVEVREALKLG